MHIQFCGAAQTVTGSQILISVNGKKILVECGLFQGKRQESYQRNKEFLFDPSGLDAVLLTHSHIDHSGNIPNLVKNGYKGSIYATPATADLCKIMLRDSAYLQLKDIEFIMRRRNNGKHPAVEPLYSIADVEEAIEAFVPIDYDKPLPVAPGVEAMFRDAGHILGSAGIHLEIKENGRSWRIGFSGDIGRPNMPLTRDPNVLRDLDMLVMETTYGNRQHGDYGDVEEDLCKIIRDTAAGGGKVIIPSFAVGRTQTLVYVLHKLFNENRLPDMPLFVDSPLACKATDIFKKYPQYLDRQAKRVFIANDEEPFEFARLTYVHTVEESKKINDLRFPCVIISGSGMAEGGRILHHLRNNVENPKNLVLFVGYAAKETLARKMMDGVNPVRIFGEEHKIRCKIRVMDAFSAHADRRSLFDYVDLNTPQRLRHIFLVHGEAEQALPLRDGLRSKGYENVHFPAQGEMYTFNKDHP
ncbi:MAG: MBL fold metallo-hydrolase [Chitinispirillaceae bacterium]|nr:MBL fold metallo-hydrolase [Chitinispirillaceae bacterium]